MQQASDLRAEGDALYELLKDLDEETWERNTPFKNWTVNEVVTHLHSTDRVAVFALSDSDTFRKMVREGAREIWRQADNQSAIASGPALCEQWHGYLGELCDLLEGIDPALRVPWFGPDMGAKMFATARQMETWAHGQDVYDLMHVAREHGDRIKNIAVIGVRTFGWSFVNRGLDIPADPPYVRLNAPSGAVWEWHEGSDSNLVAGSAVEFCHVVTQGRNIADTELAVVGDTASQWMSIAQCFAGGPEDPPAVGERV